jgi:hypothetical protein
MVLANDRNSDSVLFGRSHCTGIIYYIYTVYIILHSLVHMYFIQVPKLMYSPPKYKTIMQNSKHVCQGRGADQECRMTRSALDHYCQPGYSVCV